MQNQVEMLGRSRITLAIQDLRGFQPFFVRDTGRNQEVFHRGQDVGGIRRQRDANGPLRCLAHLIRTQVRNRGADVFHQFKGHGGKSAGRLCALKPKHDIYPTSPFYPDADTLYIDAR